MFGIKLKEARIAKGLKQSELGALLGLKNTTVSNWEKGVSNPDVEIVAKLCSILDVPASYFFDNMASEEILSFAEKKLIKKYRTLDEYGIDLVDTVLDKEYNRCIKEPETAYVLKPSYQASLSAGTGIYVFDDIPTEQIEVPAEYKDIDFVIGVNGNSMEPTFSDGDKVMIKKQHINIGEIGAFMIDGEAYIKELGNDCLISHNKDYQDIQFKGGMRIDCIGKVVGKLKKVIKDFDWED